MLLRVFHEPRSAFGYGSKLSDQGTAGFSHGFYLPGFRFGVIRFLTRSHLPSCQGRKQTLRELQVDLPEIPLAGGREVNQMGLAKSVRCSLCDSFVGKLVH